MTNDTSTLNGALTELGETMADNLTTMGVTASASDGLTTLAGKILDIQGGEAILLATDKNILSYVDSDTATLTAVHSGGSGKSLAVYNAVSGSKIGDMTDNNDGTYTYTYTSTGVGDISMTAVSGQTESNSITIEDCWAYHTTITDTDSHFTKYNWNNNWFYLSDYEVPVGHKVIMKSSTNISNCQLGIGSSSGNYFAIQPINSKIYVYVQNSSQTNVNFPTSNNEIIFELVDSQNGKLYVDNTLVGTYTLNSALNRYIKAVIYQNNVYDMSYVKIKPL